MPAGGDCRALSAVLSAHAIMVNVSLARRYARALIEVAKERAGLDAVQAQLDALAQVVRESSELGDLLKNPEYSRAERWAALQAVMNALGAVETPLQNFIRLLVDRDRIAYLGDIARVFRDMADSLAGRVRGRVTAATPLPEDSMTAIKKGLERLTDRQVILEASVEPELLGGVMARVGSTVYDGSLRSRLEELRQELKRE
jgi:F-type H+-transporting ATPase subunit delta